MQECVTSRIVILFGLAALAAPPVALGQTAPAPAFEATTLDVTTAWTGQDRGDGSGSYHLTTRVTDSRADMTIQHEIVADRSPDQEVETSESLSVLHGEDETAHAEADPAGLGVWAAPAVAYALPFDVEFAAEPRKSYRPRDRQVEELVKSAAPDARVTTRVASDGRTSATVEIPGVLPVAELARQFVGIRKAFRDADVGLAKLQIKGRAETSASAEAASTQ